ncbi:MAG: DedA family protein [Planctomycetota bacterium]
MTTILAKAANAAQTGWLEGVVDKLYDPVWNQEHSTTIWVAILCILAATGIGLPTPEDIWLTLAGFSAYMQAGEKFVWYYFVIAFMVCATANLIGDSGAWILGKKYGFGIRNRFKFMKKILSEKRMRKVQGWFDNYGSWSVFFGRQVAGIRFVTFFTAGTMRMPYWRFIFFDFMGCFFSIPLWFTLGALGAIYGREWLEKATGQAGGWVLLAGVVALVIFLIVVKSRAKKRAERDAEIFEEEIRMSTRGEKVHSGVTKPEKDDDGESVPQKS